MNVSSTSIKSQGVAVNEQEARERSGRLYRAAGNLLIIRKTAKTIPSRFIGCSRGTVKSFSAGSACRMRRYLRECLPEYKQMVTLTYPGFYPSCGAAVKEHLKRFLQELKRKYRSEFNINPSDCRHSSFWFLEFQLRGAPHFHIFTTWAPSKEWVARRWYEIVNSEDIRHLHAGTRVEFLRYGRSGTISYANKYAAKQEQKVVPENYENVGRFWGITGRNSTMAATAFVNNSEITQQNSNYVRKQLRLFINHLILIGECEIIKQDNEVGLYNIMNSNAQKKVRMYVSRIACSVMTFDNMFCDAEIE